MKTLSSINRGLSKLEFTLDVIVAFVMFATMCIVSTDVFLRYFFNAPLIWSYDLISFYFMVMLFFFCLSPALSKHAHIAVDLLQAKMSDRVRHFCDGIGYILATIVFIGIVYTAYDRTYVSFVNHDVIAGSIAWPTWIAHFVVTIGSIAMLARLIYRAVGHVLSFVLNRSVIPLPPLTGAGEEL